MASRSRPTITLITLAGDATRAEAIASDMARAWPTPETPDIRVADEADLHRIDASAVVVVETEDAAPPRLMRLADKLRERFLPGLFLVDTRQAADELRGDGILALPSATPAETLAAAVSGLMVRQDTVNSLRRELRIAQSSQGGVQLEIERMHDELNLAAQIQRESLPRSMPSMPGLDFGVIFMPAGYVSGDIYDIHAADEHRASFFLADAVGHGVPAALLTMIISRALSITRTSGEENAMVEPAHAITKLNDELVRAQRGRVRFATAICGVVDMRQQEVTLTCAGHPPPLLFGSRGVETVDVEGPLLGVFPGERYRQTTIPLEPGHTLLLYSDGFETAFPDAETPNAELKRANRRYLKQLASLRWPRPGERTLAATLESLTESLLRNTGSLHQPDDVTALAIANVRVPAETALDARSAA